MNTSTDEQLTLRKERWYVIILAAIQIAHILDFVIMMPLGPVFMRVFSISPVEFSTLVSAYTFSAGIVGFLAALYADHFDRKTFLLYNFAGFIIGTYMCAIADGFASLLTARIIAGAFGGILNSIVLSLVADLIPFHRRGAAMGVVMSAFSISSILGIPTGLYIAQLFDWHGTFYFICLLSLIFWVLSLIMLPSVRPRVEVKTFRENLSNFKTILMNRDYLQSFSLTSVLGFGVFGIIPFISAYLVKNVGFREDQLPLVYLVGGICTIVSARTIGKACDRVGSFKVFRTVAIIACFPMLTLTILPGSTPFWLALAITTLFTMFGSGRFIPAMTLVSAVVKSEDRGTFMSLENAARQMSSGISSQIGGVIIGASAAGALTNYGYVGLIGVLTTGIAIYIASKISTKLSLK